MRHTLELYRANYSMHVASLLLATYLVLQALSIPGTLCINLLIGALPLCCTRLLHVAAVCRCSCWVDCSGWCHCAAS